MGNSTLKCYNQKSMTLEELKSKLEGGIETQTFEVKGSCDWNAKSLAKDILAMSNVQDGGTIVIGIEDGTFTRLGVTPEQRDTYNVDIMKSQITHYADPHVNFKVNIITDTESREDVIEYVAITVFPFDDVPIICKKDSYDTHAGVIYHRNRNGVAQSASVSNSYDMRDIITIATVKMMQKMKKVGLTVDRVVTVEETLNKELGGL